MIRSLLVAVFFSMPLYAGQTVSLKPGGEITLEALSDKTQVICEGSSSSAKCFCEYDATGYYSLKLVLNHSVVKLSGLDYQSKCFESLSKNPACK